MKKVAAFALALSLLFAFAACNDTERYVNGFSMGSFYYAEYRSSSEQNERIDRVLLSIEKEYSVNLSSSCLFRINQAKAGEEIELTEEEFSLFSALFSLSAKTDGAFDPSLFPLVKAWGFDPPFDPKGKVPPSDSEILTALEASSLSFFTLNKETSSISKSKDDALLDFGASIKGYGAEKVMQAIEKNVKSALINVGGTIAAVNRSYLVGITHPRNDSYEYLFSFTLEQGEICATSGDYERVFVSEGVSYHHIIDRKTGRPSNSGVVSATVISENGLYADSLATAAVVLGVEKTVNLFSELGVKGALITEDKRIVPIGLNIIQIKDSSYSVANDAKEGA